MFYPAHSGKNTNKYGKYLTVVKYNNSLLVLLILFDSFRFIINFAILIAKKTARLWYVERNERFVENV